MVTNKKNKAPAKIYGPCSETQRQFLESTAFFTIYGGGAGSGKSHLSQVYSLLYKDDPQFRAVYIRQSSVQHRQLGGLWETAHDIYGDFEGTTFNESTMTVRFKSGATIKHISCGADRDLKNFDGGQYSLVVWDEVQWHSKNQISYLFSRVRSKAKGPHRVLATANPHPDAAIRPYVEWYLDQKTGIPIPERSGVVRYFAEFRGDFVFGASVEEIREKYSEKLNPQTYTFIAANIYSNPVLMQRDPSYVTRLENLKPSEKARLLDGSWYVRESNSKLFDRSWLKVVDAPPVEPATRIRCWDFAYSLQSEALRDPDFTACVLMSRTKTGIYTIEHVYHVRKQAGEHVQEVLRMYEYDGDGVQQFIPRENGPGKAWSQQFQRELIEAGVPVRSIVVSGHTGKAQKYRPFCALAEGGHVQITKGAMEEWFLTELEAFDGTRNGQHDDGVDCVSDCAIQLSRMNTLPSFVLPDFTKSSPLPT